MIEDDIVAAELGREARGEDVESSCEDGRTNAGAGDTDGGILSGPPPDRVGHGF